MTVNTESEKLVPTEADAQIKACLLNRQSFALIAGAGSGKTTSLIQSLDLLREHFGSLLRKDGQQIVCITYTNRAVDVIRKRLNQDDLFFVSTMNSFLWMLVSSYQRDIRSCVTSYLIPKKISKYTAESSGNSQKAKNALTRIAQLQQSLENLDENQKFIYSDSIFTNFDTGELGHDDAIDIAAYLLNTKPILQKIVASRFPFIFVDEAQDTLPEVIEALNRLPSLSSKPVVSYFGDPMQQIYDKRAGDFLPNPNGKIIYKTDNFRCATSVISLLNKLRDDLEQEPSGNNTAEGSVEVVIAQAKEGEGYRKAYTLEQLDRVTAIYEQVITYWQFLDEPNYKQLFLARKMIARRLGFLKLHDLFNGDFASNRAKDQFESGDYFLMKPFIELIFPIASSYKDKNWSEMFEVFKSISPNYKPDGKNRDKSFNKIVDSMNKVAAKLDELISSNATTKQVLDFCISQNLIRASERLFEHFNRNARTEKFDPDTNQQDKGEWLADEFFKLNTSDLESYVQFLLDKTPFSTQHGVKGEEYQNVLVVIDDKEAAWNSYNYIGHLTPKTLGREPTDRQRSLTSKLFYVCCSRAEENLRILLFSMNPEGAKSELIDSGVFTSEQVSLYSDIV